MTPLQDSSDSIESGSPRDATVPDRSTTEFTAVAAITLAIVALARIAESGPTTFGAAMLDTRPAIAVTTLGIMAVLAACAIAVFSLTSGRFSIIASRFDPRLVVLLASVGALPIVSLGTDTRSADSAVLISTSTFLNGGNLGWLLDSQEAVLPHAVFAPLVSAGVGFDRLALIPVLGTIALLWWVGHQVLARTDSQLIAVMAVLALLAAPTIFRQANRLTFYPWFALAGTAGILGLCRFILGSRTVKIVFPSAVLVAIAVASHGAGLYFAVVAAATVSLIRTSAERNRWLIAMMAVGVANLPWLIAHYAVSGTTRFLTPRDSWILTEGYLLDINEFFWGLSVGSRAEALSNHPSVFWSAGGPLLIPLGALAFIGLRALDRQRAIFVVLSGVILVGSLAATRSAGFPRYFYPILPGLVILASTGLHHVLRDRRTPHWSHAVFGLAALAAVVANTAEPSMLSHLDDKPRLAELAQAASFVEAGDGVLGYRSMALNIIDPEARTFHHDLIDEAEYVALYEWDQSELAEYATARDIEWVLLTLPAERWEASYNDSWFVREFGFPTSHARVLAASNCLAFAGEYVALYELARCYSP